MGCLWLNLDQEITWYESAKACAAMDSHLVEILSQDELNFVRDELHYLGVSAPVVWTDGSDEFVEGDWIWVNSFKPVGDRFHMAKPFT